MVIHLEVGRNQIGQGTGLVQAPGEVDHLIGNVWGNRHQLFKEHHDVSHERSYFVAGRFPVLESVGPPLVVLFFGLNAFKGHPIKSLNDNNGPFSRFRYLDHPCKCSHLLDISQFGLSALFVCLFCGHHKKAVPFHDVFQHLDVMRILDHKGQDHLGKKDIINDRQYG